MKKESLDIGGSVGSIKGNFYEKHFSRILENLGYKVVQYKEYIKYKDKPNIVFHKYRTAPDQFTEIDFFIPTKNIGFWVTNLGQIERYKTESSNKDFNEFKDLKGKCPHCKKSNLPNLNDEILGKWTCKKCKKIVSPFDLFEKKSVNGENVLKYKNNSASTQAHKQAYYRVGEYIEARTSEDKVACIEIIYNKRSAWRNWSPVIELFFDDTIFIFDDIGEVIGTDEFEKKLLFKIARLIKNPPQPKDSIKLLLDRASSIRDEKMKSYQNWLNEIIKSRLLKWGKNEPVSFPIRYSLYGLLKSKNRPISEIDVYIYSVLIKIKSGKLILNNLSSKEKNKLPYIKKRFSNNELNTVNEEGEEYMKCCVKEYDSRISEIKNGELYFIQENDHWFPEKTERIVDILIDLKNASIKNDWYKFIMIASYDYIELNNTPFINEQFEPLESLTYIYLNQFKKDGIIKRVYGEPGKDHYKETWLCDMPFAKNDTGFYLGTDVEIELNNGKKVYIQCKSNTSFKNWELKPGLIKNSGITYKDSKRMIAHNFFSLFKMKDKKLKFDNSRIYIAIIDGNWCATRKDIYRTLKLMYLLGVNEIFFADEFESRLKNYLIRIGA